jgi:hypothetical protein
MYFVIVIDGQHQGRAAYFDQAAPAMLRNRRAEATEWVEYAAAEQARDELQIKLPPFRLASVRGDGLNLRPGPR